MLLTTLICISAELSNHEAKTFAREAHQHGYATYHMAPAEVIEMPCDAFLLRGTDSTVQPWAIRFDGRMTSQRATDLIIAWEAWQQVAPVTRLALSQLEHFPEADWRALLTDAVVADDLCHMDGVSDVYDCLNELGMLPSFE